MAIHARAFGEIRVFMEGTVLFIGFQSVKKNRVRINNNLKYDQQLKIRSTMVYSTVNNGLFGSEP